MVDCTGIKSCEQIFPVLGVPAVTAGIPGGEPDQDAAAQPPRQLYRVPAHAAWFRYECIHANERTGVPEFFAQGGASRTPRVRACRMPELAQSAHPCSLGVLAACWRRWLPPTLPR